MYALRLSATTTNDLAQAVSALADDLARDSTAFHFVVEGSARESSPGHFGLSGIRERAPQIGANLDILRRAKAGTGIELSIAGSIAYHTSTGRPLLRLFRKTWGDL